MSTQRIFKTTDTTQKHHHGDYCEVLQTFDKPDCTHDEECLPMHLVKFANGDVIEAFDNELHIPS